MHRLVGVGCLLLAGCSGNPVCFRSANLEPQPTGLTGIVGEELRFEVAAPVFACVSDVPTAQVEAFDEDSQPVPVSAGAVRTQGGRVSVVVSLTPPTSGVLWLRVFFEPGLGTVQVPLTVARRLGDPSVIELLPASTDVSACARVRRTTRGTTLCWRDTSVTVYRDGGAVSTFDGHSLEVVGNTVWTVVDGTLQRRVDVGGSLVLEGEAPDAGALGFRGEHTELDAVRTAPDGRSALFHWNGTTLERVEDGVSTGLLVIQDQALWEVKEGVDDVDAGVIRIRPLHGDAGVLTMGNAARLRSIESAGVWATSDTSLVFLSRPFTAAPRLVSLNLFPGVAPSSFTFGVPPLTWSVTQLAFPRWAGPSVGIRLFTTPSRVVVSSDERWLLLRDGPQTISVYEMPTP